MLSVFMLSVFMLCIFMLSVLILSVVKLNVVAPPGTREWNYKTLCFAAIYTAIY
jgi:hypothetical protein